LAFKRVTGLVWAGSSGGEGNVKVTVEKLGEIVRVNGFETIIYPVMLRSCFA
jgi:hypothetical protein